MPDSPRQLRGVILTLTERCNLRCDYCYVPVERGQAMKREIVDRAIDWFAGNACDEGTLGLSFFGGEPFLARGHMRRAMSRLRALVPEGRPVRVVTPTNLLAMSEDDIAWCRQNDVELAISIDGGPDTPGRRLPAGGDGAPAIAAAVPDLLRKLPPGLALARMTVTPANVGSLCANVRSLARFGFEKIIYLPDYEAGWDEAALRLWRREHERLVTWFLGARGVGKRLPELPLLSALEARLLRGVPRGRCGAGTEQVTVAPDGGIYPCYRFPYTKDADEWRLGDVERGITRPEKLADLEALQASALRPERGDCASCAAADGCTHFCSALGAMACGDVRGVPEIACRLMEIQVAAVRELCAAGSRPRHSRPVAHPWAQAAMVALAVTGMAGCQRHTLTSPKADGGDANQARDVGIGGPRIPIDLDALAADGPRPLDIAEARADGRALDTAPIDSEQVDSEQADGAQTQKEDAPIFIGGICVVVLPNGGGVC